MATPLPHTRNTVFLGLAEGFWGVGLNVVSIATVLPVFLEQQGASRTVIALLPALTHLTSGLTQPLSGYVVRGGGHLRNWVIGLHVLAPLPIGLAALGLWSPKASPVFLVLACWAAFFGVIGVLYPMWLDYMARVLLPEKRGRAFGVIFFLQTSLGALGALAAAWILDLGTSLGHYAVLFAAAWALFTGGGLFYLGTRGERPTGPSTERVSLLRHLGSLLRLGRRTPWFRAYLPARVLVRSTFYLILSFYAVHAVAAKGVSPATAALFGTASLGCQALAGILLGALGDRFGHKVPVMLGQGAMVLAAALVLLPLPVWAYFFVAALVGIFSASEIAGQNNWLIDLAGPEHRRAFISLTMFLATPAAVLVTFFGGVLMDRVGFPAVAAGVGLAFLAAMVVEGWALPRRGGGL